MNGFVMPGRSATLVVAGALMTSAAAAADVPASVGVAPIISAEPDGSRQGKILFMTGHSDASGAAGRFTLTADLASGRETLTIVSGGVSDADGWDAGAWSAHDGAVETIDLPGAVADARAEAFLRKYAWRDPAARTWMRPAGQRTDNGRTEDGVAVAPPGTSPMHLWFDVADHHLIEAVVEADMGPLAVRFADWRTVGRAAYAFRRERRDATGQTTLLVTDQAALRPGPAPQRPRDAMQGRRTDRTTVPFVLDHLTRGHIVVAARIDDKPVRLVFDTGAANYLTPTVAAELGLKVEGGLSVGGVGESSFAGGFARIRSLTIGTARLEATSAIIAPLPDSAIHPRPGLELQGLAGAELLHAFRTTIDYGAKTLSFAPLGMGQAAAGVSLRYASDGQTMFVSASVDGRLGWFRLDTGDAGSVTLFATFAQRWGFVGVPKTHQADEAGGALRTTAAKFDSITFAGQSFRKVPGEISGQGAGAFASRSIAGNIGAGILSCFRLTIDRSMRQIELDPLPAVARPPSCHASG